MTICAICPHEVKKNGRVIEPHGLMCGSCAYSFFCWKRGKSWLRTVR